MRASLISSALGCFTLCFHMESAEGDTELIMLPIEAFIHLFLSLQCLCYDLTSDKLHTAGDMVTTIVSNLTSKYSMSVFGL